MLWLTSCGPLPYTIDINSTSSTQTKQKYTDSHSQCSTKVKWPSTICRFVTSHQTWQTGMVKWEWRFFFPTVVLVLVLHCVESTQQWVWLPPAGQPRKWGSVKTQLTGGNVVSAFHPLQKFKRPPKEEKNNGEEIICAASSCPNHQTLPYNNAVIFFTLVLHILHCWYGV